MTLLTNKTMRGVKALTDWRRTLQSRSVYALVDGLLYRVVAVGWKYVTILELGKRRQVKPSEITGFEGLN